VLNAAHANLLVLQALWSTIPREAMAYNKLDNTHTDTVTQRMLLLSRHYRNTVNVQTLGGGSLVIAELTGVSSFQMTAKFVKWRAESKSLQDHAKY